MIGVGGQGCPPSIKSPQYWEIKGLIETISAFSKIVNAHKEERSV
jgi:hypothetical protein